MAANYPGGTDSFSEPSSPTTTKLNDPTYDHTSHHQRLGDAIEAIEAALGLNPAKVEAAVSGNWNSGTRTYTTLKDRLDATPHISVGSTQPTSPALNDVWIDTST